jgi:type IV pilus assembly protein PilC
MPQTVKTQKVSGIGRIINNELAPFSRQLASMLRAGMSLVISLMTIEEQMDNKNFKIVLSSVRETVEGGGSFSDGLSKWPKIFNDLYINIVRSGERSGQFAESMARLSQLLESSAKLRRKVKSALSYPIVVLCMAFGIAFAMITFVVPVFAEMFSGFGKALPGPTQLLVDISDFIRGNWWWLIPGVIVGIFFFRRWAATETGAYKMDQFKLKLPVFGELNQKVAVARFARIFSQMVHSGVPILDGLAIVAKACGNRVIGQSIMDARTKVEQGDQISNGLDGRPGVPLLLTRMVAAGEKSGKLDEMLDSIASTYEDEVEAMLASLTSLMEPMLMGFMGVLIGGIVIAMYLPIFKMSSIIN